MKRTLLFLFPILLLASCAQYDNSIHGTNITPNGWALSYDSVGHAIGTHQVMDTTYTISPTWKQAWKWAGERNDRIWFFIGIALFVIPMGIFIYLGNKGGQGMSILVLPVFAILVGGGVTGGSIEWERWNMDQSIEKTQYDKLMKDPGNLGPFWDTIRIK